MAPSLHAGSHAAPNAARVADSCAHAATQIGVNAAVRDSGVAGVALAGVLLCGGRSSRMGSDKAVLRHAGRTLLEHGLACLDELAAHVVLACGSSERYGEHARPLVLDAFEHAGPLAGLLAALEHDVALDRTAGLERAVGRTPAARVAVLAVDMPDARADIYRALHRRAADADLDVAMLRGPRGDEPLCAIVHRRCAGAIRRALTAGERRMVAFHSAEGMRVAAFSLAELGLASQGAVAPQGAVATQGAVAPQGAVAIAATQTSAGHDATLNVNTPSEWHAFRARAANGVARA